MNESLSVLIVDDDVSIQNVVEDILRDGSFEPKAASSVEEAIALLNAHRFRAVIIDISFGKDHVKGWAVARRARAFNPALPIIYITGGNTDEWAIQGVPNSILITKPFPPVTTTCAPVHRIGRHPLWVRSSSTSSSPTLGDGFMSVQLTVRLRRRPWD